MNLTFVNHGLSKSELKTSMQSCCHTLQSSLYVRPQEVIFSMTGKCTEQVKYLLADNFFQKQHFQGKK